MISYIQFHYLVRQFKLKKSSKWQLMAIYSNVQSEGMQSARIIKSVT